METCKFAMSKINIMKKVITLCILAIALVAGGFTLQAKTTKKNSKARTTQNAKPAGSGIFGIMTFCTKGNKYDGPGAKSVNEIISALKKLGFKYEQSYDASLVQYDEYEDEYYNKATKIEEYSKVGITALIYVRINNGEKEMNNWPYQVWLNFDDASQLNNFIATVKANDFVGQHEDDGIMYYSRKQPSGVSVKKTEGAYEIVQISFFDSH